MVVVGLFCLGGVELVVEVAAVVVAVVEVGCCWR